MHFDGEGHLVVTPREIHEMALADRAKLINSVLLPGTPAAISTHARHADLLSHISNAMGIHPNNLFFRGSTKIGFSIAPTAVKIWMKYGPASDLDLAIVDPWFFQLVDHEVRRWEWKTQNRSAMFRDPRLYAAYLNRASHKGRFDCFRNRDLPKIACMEELNACLDSAPVEACCGLKRPMRAFMFRDWWGVCKRYDYDLYCLCRGLQDQERPLPAGGDVPRPYEELADAGPDIA